MINGNVVIDGVAHAYNLSDDNTQTNRYANAVREVLISLHRDWQPGIGLDDVAQRTDWPMEVVAQTLFLESDVDMSTVHTLRMDSYFKDGLVARAKTVEAVRRWPHRFIGYVGLDPTRGLDYCLRDLEEQLDELPEALGLKLYPAQVDPLRSWRMDDPKLAFPLFELARDRGVKTVAVHKAVPLGPVPMNPYRIDDIDCAADAFPDLSFEIVHAGMAFAEETALAIGRFPNVYANLEGTTCLINTSPGLFEDILAQFMMWGGPGKVLFADGCMVQHPQPILDTLRTFQFSDATLAKYGLPQVTPEMLAPMLGLNYVRLLDLDLDTRMAAIEADEFTAQRRETGLQAPYSNWKKALAVAA